MTVYIAGPITGLPDGNRAAFLEADAMLRAKGHRVLNPVYLCAPDTPWPDAMRRCLRVLTGADGIYLLDGWRRSRGAKLERLVAKALGIVEVRL